MKDRYTIQLLKALVWIIATAGVAYGVARNTNPIETTPLPVVPEVIGASVRTVVEASPQVIASVVSLDARVVQDGDRWLLEAPVANDEIAYKLADPPIAIRALISGGPAGFECAWAGTGIAADGGVSTRCSVPAEIRVIPGLAGIMALQFDEPVAAETALPVSAVLGSTTQGQVIVVSADGARTLRSVQIGASDGLWIEITGGLQPGDQVLEFPTQRDFAEAGE